MTKVLCMSHGPLARGMVETAQFIIGKNQYLEYLCAYIDGNDDLEKTISEYVTANGVEPLIVVTDIFGGSINNEWMKYISTISSIHLIAGMNLSLVIELVVKLDSQQELTQLIQEAIKTSAQGLIYCNQLTYEEENEEF
ncbi:PTS sugar transporter subunit IIA [Enterococcus mundtii]|uniref:PTS fructose IIA subunit n=1 Tax=Enterococcus mundtii TaxID=53346 RepID=A0A2S7RX87_ENTMU|nr:PTS fructose IIA subunit [Enterococcus mundtii]PQF24653.1 PTS fructose IIA subunit [Enterococcus mundtii]